MRIFRSCVVGHECFFKCWAIELVSRLMKFAYIYILYIYIYIWMNMLWVSPCLRTWATKEGILSPASLKRHRGVQKTFLCLYLCEDHTKSYALENLRDQKRRTKDVSLSKVRLRNGQLGVRLQSGGSDIQSSGRGAGQSRTKTQSNGDDGQISQHFK